MKTAYKIGLGVAFCGLFLGLAILGVSVKVETKPDSASASTVTMMWINGTHGSNPQVTPGTTVTVTWQAPAGYSYCNTGVSPTLPLPAFWGGNQPVGMDKATSGSYTVVAQQSMRFQLQCAVDKNSPMTIEDGVAVDVIQATAGSSNSTSASFCPSGNITTSAAVYCQKSGANWSNLCTPKYNITTSLTNNSSLNLQYTVPSTHCASIRVHAFVDSTEVAVSPYLGHYGSLPSHSLPKSATLSLGNVTAGSHTISLQGEVDGLDCGGGNRGLASWGGNVVVTPAINQCTNTTTCTPNGTLTQKCVGNSIYNFDSCSTQGSLVQNCSGSCLDGVCVTNVNNNCVPNGTVTQKCVGNSVYNFNSCDTQLGLVQNCSGSCSSGACVNTVTNNNLSVTTNPASNIVNNSATLNGYLNNLGADPSVSVWFQWGTTTSYSNGDTTASTKSAAGPFSFTITSLTPNTQYHFRAVAENGTGRMYGEDRSFTSAQTASLGQVQTLSANTITTTSVNLNGQLSSLGGASSGQVFFQWGPTVTYGNVTTNQTQNVSGPFSQVISGLATGTTYHFRAGLTTSAGTVYGDDQTFTTNQNNNGGGNTCTSGQNYTQKCSGSGLYWFDSCGNQTSWTNLCGYNQTCSNNTCVNINNNNNNNYNNNYYYTQNSYQRCSGNYLTWYDSYGNAGSSQYCSGGCNGNVCNNNNNNNNFSNLSVNVQARNLSTGNLNWSNNISASPSDILQFQIAVQVNSNNYYNNVTVRDVLPNNLYYNNSLMVDGVSNSGSIITGINLGSTTQSHTITYQVQVAAAQNFNFNSSPVLYDAVTATSTDGGYGSGSASVTVNRQGVLGATDVSTGPLTGNFLVDSFLLPLALALAGVWAWKSGILNNLAIAGWVNGKKSKISNFVSGKALESKIAEIKAKEKL